MCTGNKNMVKQYSTPFVILNFIIIVFFGVLAYLFPYTSDDWAWGSQIGLDRLSNFFDHYNGRYLGNLLVITLTRSRILRAIVMSLTFYVICWLCYKYTAKAKKASLLFAFILFLCMPQSVFAQSVAWTSGFANYVPSAVCSVAYLLLIKNTTGKETPRYPKYLFPTTFFLGFFGALFVENITLFNLFLGIAVIIYAFIRFKKLFPAHIAFLIGAAAGTAWMFSNSIYSSSLSGTHGDRNLAQGIPQLLSTAMGHLYIACNTLVLTNVAMCVIICAFVILLTFNIAKRKPGGWQKRFSIGAAIANVLCLAFILLEKTFILIHTDNTLLNGILNLLQSSLVRVGIALLFVISIFVVILTCVEKEKQLNMLLPLLCIPVMVAPLLVVNPVGPRCFFGAYLMMMVFLVDLFSYLHALWETNATKKLLYGLTVTAILQVIVCVAIFYPAYRWDLARTELITAQSNEHATEIVICDLPNAEFMWECTPKEEYWIARYKLFYGIDKEAKIKIVSKEEFNALYQSYIKEG